MTSRWYYDSQCQTKVCAVFTSRLHRLTTSTSIIAPTIWRKIHCQHLLNSMELDICDVFAAGYNRLEWNSQTELLSSCCVFVTECFKPSRRFAALFWCGVSIRLSQFSLQRCAHWSRSASVMTNHTNKRMLLFKCGLLYIKKLTEQTCICWLRLHWITLIHREAI